MITKFDIYEELPESKNMKDYEVAEQVKNGAIDYSNYITERINSLMPTIEKQKYVKQTRQRTQTSPVWDRLRIESKIMIVLTVIGLLLSFLSLILK